MCLTQAHVANAEESKDSPYPTEIVELAKKANNGPLSDAEANQLITEYPDLAAALPDYRPGKNSHEEFVTPEGDQTEEAQLSCSTAHRIHHSKTLLGETFYDLETSVRFCWEQSRVTQVDPPSSHFTNISPFANITGEIDKRAWVENEEGHAKHMYQVVNQIPWIGTWNTKHPYNEFILHAGGDASSWGGE